VIKFWLAFSWVIVFAAGGAVGFLAFRSMAPMQEGRPAWFPPPGFFREPLKIEKLYGELGLNEQQQKTIDFLLRSNAKQVSELHSAMSNLAKQLRDGIEAVLTTAQSAILADLQEKAWEREDQERVTRELQSLRTELALTPDLERRMEAILLDIAREKRKVLPSLDQKGFGEKMEEISARRLALLAEVLSPSQLSIYKEIKEHERDRFHRRGERERGKKALEEGPGLPAPPTASPPRPKPEGASRTP